MGRGRDVNGMNWYHQSTFVTHFVSSIVPPNWMLNFWKYHCHLLSLCLQSDI